MTGGLLRLGSAEAAPTFRLENKTVEERLQIFLKIVSDLSGAPSHTWASGSLFAWMPGLGGHQICDIHTVTTHRVVKSAVGWIVLAREGVLFSAIGETTPLPTWPNPFTQAEVSVVPTVNDQVSRRYETPPEGWVIGSYVGFADNHSSLNPSPMTVEEYPLYTQRNAFKFVSLRTYYAPISEIQDQNVTSVSTTGVNTSVSPWLPWMEMGQRQGWLVWQQRLKKATTIDAIPEGIKTYWLVNAPRVFEVPLSVNGEDDNAWLSFKRAVDHRRLRQP